MKDREASTYDIRSLSWWVGFKNQISPIKIELYTKRKLDMGGEVINGLKIGYHMWMAPYISVPTTWCPDQNT